MDPFSSFHEEIELLWDFSPEDLGFIPAVDPVGPRSAFVRYSGTDPAVPRSNGGLNIHMRVAEILRRIPGDSPESRAGREDRGFRHMMRERHRREKLSQCYADLYSMLSPRSKADKNSIVQSAASCVRELRGVKEQLRRRNEELKGKIAEGEKIRMRVASPLSAIDSMIGALRCLKGMGVKATAIRSDLSDREVSAIVTLGINKVGTTELERAVEGALMEVEQKLQASLLRRSCGSQQCHVER